MKYLKLELFKEAQSTRNDTTAALGTLYRVRLPSACFARFHDTKFPSLRATFWHVRRDAAAIGSERAAELYGLQVLERDIQGDSPNICRFLVLSRDPLVTGEPLHPSPLPSLSLLDTSTILAPGCSEDTACLGMP